MSQQFYQQTKAFQNMIEKSSVLRMNSSNFKSFEPKNGERSNIQQLNFNAKKSQGISSSYNMKAFVSPRASNLVFPSNYNNMQSFPQIQPSNTNKFNTSQSLRNHQLNSKKSEKSLQETSLQFQIQLDKQKYRYQTKLSSLQQQVQSLKKQNITLAGQNKQMNQSLTKYIIENQKLSQSNTKLQKQRDQYLQKMNIFQKQNIELKSIKKTNYEDLLKEQFEQNFEIQKQISENNQKIIELKESNNQLQRNVTYLANQISAQKAKWVAENNSLEKQYQLKILDKVNQVKELQRKVNNIENKVKDIVRENKKKDEFIENFLVKRGGQLIEQQQIKKILNEYICQFSEPILTQIICQKEKRKDNE